MARRRRGERVKGVYHYPRGRKRWRVVCIDGEGKETADYFATKKEAEDYARVLQGELSDQATLGAALQRYEVRLRKKGNKQRSIDTTVGRLRTFFADDQLRLYALRIPKLQRAYDRYRREPTARTGKPPQVDTHRNTLSEAKSFLRWAYKKGLVTKALIQRLNEVEGVGKRRKRKEQLRITEARRWDAIALKLAEDGEQGAVAALLTLYMNLRCTEVVTRTVRDVDDEGKYLWVSDTKTDAGRRTQEVPEVLVPILWELTKGRQPDELLFGKRWRDWPRDWVKRICTMAGVPVVTAHGMRGTHASLAEDFGQSSKAVAAAMGHASDRVTREHYTDPSVVPNVQQRRVLRVLEGGRRRPEREEPTRGSEPAQDSERNTEWNRNRVTQTG